MRAIALTTCLLLPLAGCAVFRAAGQPARPYEPQVAHALPEADPAARGTPQGATLLLSEAEQVSVRLGRGPDGRVVLLHIVSPSLSTADQEALRRAFEAGEWKRTTPLAPDAESWIENIVRTRR
jgi:hypothetical protein